MAYIIGFLILLFLIGAATSAQETRKGARQLKNSVQQKLQLTAPASSHSLLILLLERLHIEGYAFGPTAGDATPNAPAVVHDAELSAFLQRLMADSTLEQVLPRIGFCVRSTASCHDTTLSRQYPRMLITPTLHAIGYRPD